jgi:hypothetical protein
VKLTAKYSLHCRAHVENLQVVETSRVTERCVPHPALSVCDSFGDNCRLFLFLFKLAGKLVWTGLTGQMLAIHDADAARKAKVDICLENAVQVVFGRLASLLGAIQLANSSADHGQRFMSRRLADAHVLIDSI